ncbi:hypothetical protein [Saccharothrix lopnurensis]|uniref:DUF222 domain-containing protein n=1 Tax=Saccharothrix lopnurensis TaxID=1670621 RepID=A0ABW1P8D1_9PSEU
MREGTTMRVDPSNAEQLRAWDGDQGAYWAARAERFDEGVAGYQDRLLTAAAIEPGSTVLTDGLDEADRARAVADLRADMADHLTDRGCGTARRRG